MPALTKEYYKTSPQHYNTGTERQKFENYSPVEEVGEKHKIKVRKAPHLLQGSTLPRIYGRFPHFFTRVFYFFNSCYPSVACRKVALVAFPIHPLVVVEAQSLAFLVPLPYQALAVQAKQEAATEHTCSAVEAHNQNTERNIEQLG